jgi:uncharacterized membrane protein
MMNVKPIRWLYGELPGLVSGGVIDEAAAGRLRDHYGPLPEAWSGRNLFLLIFGALGALLVGGGITLLLAHNWEQLGRPARTAMSFALLLAAQALAGWTLWRRRGSQAWIEGSGLFLALAVVSVMMLIGQTYHMTGDLEGLLLAWIVLIAPLVYLMSSRGVTALVWAGSTWWFLHGSWWDPSLLRPALYVILTGSTVPFLVRLWRRHRAEPPAALIGWAVAGSLLVAGIRLLNLLGADLWIPFYAGTLGTFYVAGLAAADRMPDGSTWWKNPFHTAGAIGLAILFFNLGFLEVWRDEWAFDATRLENLVIMMVIALGLCAVATLGAIRLLKTRKIHQAALAFLPAVAVIAWLLQSAGPGYAAVLTNLAALAAGLTVCISGARQGRLGTANGGLILVLAILAARFFDAEVSFIVRGVGFILLGLGLLGVNVLILRRRKEGAS